MVRALHLGALAGASLLFAQPNALSQDLLYRQSQTTGEAGSKFGWSIAGNGQWVAIGVPFSDELNGAVVIYDAGAMLTEGLVPETTLTETIAPIAAQRFGATVAVSDGLVAVGNCSVQETTGQYCNASAQRISLFEYDGTGFVELDTVGAPTSVTGGSFGLAFTLTDDWLAVGGARIELNTMDAVYLYKRNGPGTDFPDLPNAVLSTLGSTGFGRALAMNGRDLLIGAHENDELGVDAGAVFVYRLNDSDEWEFVRKVLASDGTAGAHFGYSVALRDNIAAVGAPGDVSAGTAIGAAYVLDRDAGLSDNWGETASLRPYPWDEQAGMGFGTTVAVGPNSIAVGAPKWDMPSSDNDGLISIFSSDGSGGWAISQAMVPYGQGHVNLHSRCATSLAYAQVRLLVGAPWARIGPSTNPITGGVLVYSPEVVGVEELSIGGGAVWPIPFEDHLMLRAPRSVTGSADVEMIDATGRCVMRMMIADASSPIAIERAGIAPGAYALVLRSRNGGGSWRANVIAQ